MRDTHLENYGVRECVMMCDRHFGKSFVLISRDTHLENSDVGDCLTHTQTDTRKILL